LAGRIPAAGLFFFQLRERETMRRKLHLILTAVLLCAWGAGCGSSTGKNIYKDKDKPKPAEKEK
jgi:hypothetical protein